MKIHRRNCIRHCSLGISLCVLFVFYLYDQSTKNIDDSVLEYYSFEDGSDLRDEDYEIETAKLAKLAKEKRDTLESNTAKYTNITNRTTQNDQENMPLGKLKIKPKQNAHSKQKNESTCAENLNAFPNILDLNETRFHKSHLDWLHIYSAHLMTEENKRNAAKIIAMVNINGYHGNKNTAFCRFFSKGKSELAQATIRLISQKDSFLFRDAIITCDMENGMIPESVAIVTHPCKNVTHAWKLRIAEVKENASDFVVCIALPTSYHNFQEFREFIEVNRMFGFEHFAIYYNHIGETVRKYLDYYTKIGLIQTFKWNIPNDIRQNSHFEGKLAIYNQCLFSYKYSTKYLVFLNVNELLVPQNTNWKQFKDTQPGGTCAYLFKTATFWKDSTSQTNHTFSLYGSHTLKRTIRDRIIQSHDSSSRYFSNVNYLKVAGDTKPIMCENSVNTVLVDRKIALAHLYVSNFSKGSNYTTEDKTMHVYGNKILSQILHVAEKINRLK